MIKKNKILYFLYLFLFFMFFISFYSLERLQLSKIQKYDINSIDETNHIKVSLKYISIPSFYLEYCILKLMSNSYQEEYNCHDYSEINTVRNFVQTLDKTYYYLTERNKNVGYYTLYIIKNNLGPFSEEEKKEVFDKFYLFVEKEYLKSDFNFEFYEEKNQNFKYQYLSSLKHFYGSIENDDFKEKFNIVINKFNIQLKKKFLNKNNIIFIEVILLSFLSTFLIIFIIKKFYFKK
jgi:hypothetical protein